MAFLGIKSKKDKLNEQSVSEALSLIKQLAAQTAKFVQIEKNSSVDMKEVMPKVNGLVKSTETKKENVESVYSDVHYHLSSVYETQADFLFYQDTKRHVDAAEAGEKEFEEGIKSFLEDVERLKKEVRADDLGQNHFHRYGEAQKNVCDQLKELSGAITDYFSKIDKAVEDRTIKEKEANEKKQSVIKTYIEDEIGKCLWISDISFGQEDVKEQMEVLNKDVRVGKVSKEEGVNQMKALETLENMTKNHSITLTDLKSFTDKNVEFLNVVLASRQILTRKIMGLANSSFEHISKMQKFADKRIEFNKKYWGQTIGNVYNKFNITRDREVDKNLKIIDSNLKDYLNNLGIKGRENKKEVISKLIRGEENPISKAEEARYRYSLDVKNVFKQIGDLSLDLPFDYVVDIWCAERESQYEQHNIRVQMLQRMTESKEKLPFLSDETRAFMFSKVDQIYVVKKDAKYKTQELEKKYLESTGLKKASNSEVLFDIQKRLVRDFIEKHLGDNPIEAYATNKEEIDLAARNMKEKLEKELKALMNTESRSVKNTM